MNYVYATGKDLIARIDLTPNSGPPSRIPAGTTVTVIASYPKTESYKIKAEKDKWLVTMTVPAANLRPPDPSWDTIPRQKLSDEEYFNEIDTTYIPQDEARKTLERCFVVDMVFVDELNEVRSIKGSKILDVKSDVVIVHNFSSEIELHKIRFIKVRIFL